MTSHHAFAATLRDLVREIVRDELRASTTTAPIYGSGTPYPPIPGRSYRWCRDHIPSMPGARREGGKRGRGVVHTISREHYEAWLASRNTTKPKENASALTTAPANDVDAWIVAAGYRATRRGNR